MKKRLQQLVLTVALALLFTAAATAQETVEEPSSGKTFPREITFNYDGQDYTLTATGVAVRKKFIFKVYGMVHYMQDPVAGTAEEALNEVLSEGKAKQITMDFARGVGSGKIQGAYREGFEKNATEEELKEIQPLIDQFVGYFDKKVEEDQQYVLRWMPDGSLISIVQGELKPVIKNNTFARVLWSIWLGEKSIVNREDLVGFITQK